MNCSSFQILRLVYPNFTTTIFYLLFSTNRRKSNPFIWILLVRTDTLKNLELLSNSPSIAVWLPCAEYSTRIQITDSNWREDLLVLLRVMTLKKTFSQRVLMLIFLMDNLKLVFSRKIIPNFKMKFENRSPELFYFTVLIISKYYFKTFCLPISLILLRIFLFERKTNPNFNIIQRCIFIFIILWVFSYWIYDQI